MTTSTFFANILALNNIDDETRAKAKELHAKAVAEEAKAEAKRQEKRDADTALVNAMIDALKSADEPMTTSEVAGVLGCSPSKVTALYKGYLADDTHIVRGEAKDNKNAMKKTYAYKA